MLLGVLSLEKLKKKEPFREQEEELGSLGTGQGSF